MDTRSIQCFIACYETHSINKAAGVLYITPQGLGKIINKLEEELGAPLFERTRRGLVPTECGSYFYEQSRGLVRQLHTLQMEMKRIVENENKIRVGYSIGIMNIFNIEKIETFQMENSHGYSGWTEGFNDEIIEMVQDGRLDVAFVIGDREPAGILRESLFQKKLSALVYEGHPLFTRKSLVFRDLENEPLILLNEKFWTFHSVVQRCTEAGFLPRIHIKTMESFLIYQFTNRRRGIGIDVNIHPEQLAGRALKPIEIEDSIPWSVNAICRAENRGDPRIRDLVDFCRGCIVF